MFCDMMQLNFVIQAGSYKEYPTCTNFSSCSCDCGSTLKACTSDIKFHEQFAGYACICGLQDYQIAYATQAAETERKVGVIIYKKIQPKKYCKAHILGRNYSQTDEKLYLGFDERDIRYFRMHFEQEIKQNKSISVDVRFQLKDSYFNNLKKSVANLPSDVIHRILPCDHPVFSQLVDVPTVQTMDLDSEQKEALIAILTPTLQNGPPLLITGPFGTGKTRIMALAAHELFQRVSSTRILVCTQQRESADNFMLMYRGVVSKSGSDDYKVKKIILRDYGHRENSLRKFYVDRKGLPHDLASKDNIIIVTTCLTAHHLVHTNIQFSHIFVDEGAQMREPEAVAALRMANQNTTLVIAGDPQQVNFNTSCMHNIIIMLY